jgi:beta-N-acetylhexosaminidase
VAASAVIFGCAGTKLTEEEWQFFREAQPWGFILFQRNCQSPEQVKALTSEMRSIVGRTNVPILIDQEGGRVARLKPPHWRLPPAAAKFAALYGVDHAAGHDATYLNSRLIAEELLELGITVNCTPCLDVPQTGSHRIIGDRAYGSDPQTIVALASDVCKGLLEGGVLPVIKHMPGHGRAKVDSHEDLPVVDASPDELAKTDFVPFRLMNRMPLGMSAHVVYTAIDANRPATISPRVIHTVIRGDIGFDGLLMTDDLSMKALKEPFADRARHAIHAGIDVVLHCNGDMSEMRQVIPEIPVLAGDAQRRASAAESQIGVPSAQFDRQQAVARLDDWLGRVA